jgi:hypothetical protein
MVFTGSAGASGIGVRNLMGPSLIAEVLFETCPQDPRVSACPREALVRVIVGKETRPAGVIGIRH